MSDLLTPRDRTRLAGLHPDLVRVVERARLAVPFFVVEGMRTLARQKELFAKGASKTMDSRHLTGHAVDLYPMGWTQATPASAFKPVAEAMRAAAKVEGVAMDHGIDWGWDAPHHELRRSVYPAQPAAPLVKVGDAPAAAHPPLSSTDRDTLIRTVWGEAEGEGPAGQAAVIHVIRNRVAKARTDAATECLRPRQFSCWNEDEPRRKKVLLLPKDGAVYRAIGGVVERAWTAPDTTGGARHYLTTALLRSATAPAWTKPPAKVSAVIGGHSFMVGVA